MGLLMNVTYFLKASFKHTDPISLQFCSQRSRNTHPLILVYKQELIFHCYKSSVTLCNLWRLQQTEFWKREISHSQPVNGSQTAVCKAVIHPQWALIWSKQACQILLDWRRHTVEQFTKPQVYVHFEIECNSKIWTALIVVLGFGLHIRTWLHILQGTQQNWQASRNFKNASFHMAA